MAKDHRRLNAELAQEVLLDDPGFLRQIVERVRHPKVAEHPEEHIEGASLACDLPRVPPPAHPHHQWPGEAQPGDIKRHSRVARIFPNRQASLRLVSALAVEHSEEWVPGRRYLDMRELEEYRRQEEQEAEEARRMER